MQPLRLSHAGVDPEQVIGVGVVQFPVPSHVPAGVNTFPEHDAAPHAVPGVAT